MYNVEFVVILSNSLHIYSKAKVLIGLSPKFKVVQAIYDELIAKR